MIDICKKCGREMDACSIGWYCPWCGSFEDMNGNIHEHKEEPFMPSMTNADKIRKMSDLQLYINLCECVPNDLCGEKCHWFNKCGGSPNEFMQWLKREVD